MRYGAVLLWPCLHETYEGFGRFGETVVGSGTNGARRGGVLRTVAIGEGQNVRVEEIRAAILKMGVELKIVLR